MIYTTYLAKLKNDPKMPERIGSCFVYHIAIARAPKENRCVAPSWKLLNYYKSTSKSLGNDEKASQILWQNYEEDYLKQIRESSEAQDWIQKRSADAILGNILLICYEKSNEHCHRRLLAEEIARFTGLNGKHAEYRGEFELKVVCPNCMRVHREDD